MPGMENFYQLFTIFIPGPSGCQMDRTPDAFADLCRDAVPGSAEETRNANRYAKRWEGTCWPKGIDSRVPGLSMADGNQVGHLAALNSGPCAIVVQALSHSVIGYLHAIMR